MIDLKHEIERELSLIDPPDLWDRIQAEASDAGAPEALDLASARHRRRPSVWLSVAAVAACLAALAFAAVVMSERSSVETTDPSGGGEEQSIVLLSRMRFSDGPLAGGTLHLDDVSGEGDDTTGTLRFDGVHDGMTLAVDCSDTDTETAAAGFIVFAAEVTTPPADGTAAVGDRVFVVIRRDDPTTDSQGDTIANESVLVTGAGTAGSCSTFLDSAPGDLLTKESSWSHVDNTPSGTASGPKTTVHGSFEIIDAASGGTSPGVPCSGEGPYDDLRSSTQVVLRDGTGSVLARTTLGPGETLGPAECGFKFVLEDVPSGLDVYVVAIGGRGEASYTFEQLARSGITISVGDPHPGDQVLR